MRFTKGMDGLLGVAGMMTLLVMKWIIPENSLRLAPVSIDIVITINHIIVINHIITIVDYH